MVFRSTNSRDWQIWWTSCGLLFVLGTAPGLALFSSKQHLGLFLSFTKPKCRTSVNWCPSHCLTARSERFARYPVLVACFSVSQRGVCCESHYCWCGVWVAVVEAVNGGTALISIQPPAPSPFVCQFTRRNRPGLSHDRCQVKRKPSKGYVIGSYITEGVLHSYLIQSVSPRRIHFVAYV